MNRIRVKLIIEELHTDIHKRRRTKENLLVTEIKRIRVQSMHTHNAMLAFSSVQFGSVQFGLI